MFLALVYIFIYLHGFKYYLLSPDIYVWVGMNGSINIFLSHFIFYIFIYTLRSQV
jgi:hypothetical protein